MKTKCSGNEQRTERRGRVSLPVGKVFAVFTLAATLGAGASPAFAQGSVFGLVLNSDVSAPAKSELSFFGFLDDRDNELRTESSTGAGYDNGNWFDDFQNYLDEAPGQPYRYYFNNDGISEANVLIGLVPNNSFQQENIQLLPVNTPPTPGGLTAVFTPAADMRVSWNETAGLTYHVYRRFTVVGGSFFRVDNTLGDLTDRGVSGGELIDTTVSDTTQYEYIIIAEDDTGALSSHSSIALSATPGVCCVTAGDATNDGKVNIGDITFLIARIFNFGVAPACQDQADANGDNKVNIADVTFLIARIFQFGPSPVCGTTGS